MYMCVAPLLRARNVYLHLYVFTYVCPRIHAHTHLHMRICKKRQNEIYENNHFLKL